MSEPVISGALRRSDSLARLQRGIAIDLLVIGGGATGLGIALDAAVRGLSVVLLERHDFAKGTSSRSTKLVHGGVRYLAQGNIGLVREALRERRSMLDNAPHLVQPLPFLMPVYGFKGKLWDKLFYGSGLVMYDRLAGRAGLGNTAFFNAADTRQTLPGISADDLSGSVRYWDGQFDDARYAIALARSATAHGATVLNYCTVTSLLHYNGKVYGARAVDTETGAELTLNASCVINATGAWVDTLRQMNGTGQQTIVAPSQGVHLVVDRDFLASDHALLVPKTKDGRVLFAVPWQGKVLLGTTDTLRHELADEPEPLQQEIDFILSESARYLARAPSREDIRSMWAGLRPLVKPTDGNSSTQSISREHTVIIDDSNLVTVTGGKWTTYRAIAEDVLDQCMDDGLLPRRASGATRNLRLVGAPQHANTPISAAPGSHLYGNEATILNELPGANDELAPSLSTAMVRFALRYEGARTIEDVLARRSRMLFLDAAMAEQLAPRVAAIINEELGRPASDVDSFAQLASHYRPYQVIS
jgi:glycerol-3-phosphate dehydrogenase